MGKKKTAGEHKPAGLSADEALFAKKSLELKSEGDLHFARKELGPALASYERALTMTPAKGSERADIHAHRAACFLRWNRYAEAVRECTSALEAEPGYSKALVWRARALEMLGDQQSLTKSLSDLDALAKAGYSGDDAKKARARVKEAKTALANERQAKKGLANPLGRPGAMPGRNRAAMEQLQREQIAQQRMAQQQAALAQQQRQLPNLTFKFILGDETKEVELPMQSTYTEVLAAAHAAYGEGSGPFALKFTDQDGDLITVAMRNDLHQAIANAVDAHRKANAKEETPTSPASLPPITLTLAKVDKSPVEPNELSAQGKSDDPQDDVVEIDEWLLNFANLFRKELGMTEEEQPDLREIGLDKCCETLEAALAKDVAMEYLDAAADKFQEAAAAALYNLGNVFICRYRKRLDTNTAGLAHGEKGEAKAVQHFDFLERQYAKMTARYEESLGIKPDFYESASAWGTQAFERAKVLNAVSKARDGGEAAKYARLADQAFALSCSKYEHALELVSGDDDGDADDAAKDAAPSQRSQINVLWGNVLFEMSQAKFRRGDKTWRNELDQALAKFKEAKCPDEDVQRALAGHVSGEWRKESEAATVS